MSASAVPLRRDRTVAETVVNFMTPEQRLRAGGLQSSGDFGIAQQPGTTAALQQVERRFEKVGTRISHVETKVDRQDSLVEALQKELQRLDQENSHLRRDLEAANKQLDKQMSDIDREVGNIADLNQNFRYLTMQMQQWHNEQLTPAQASYWAVAGWIYIPLLHVIRGLWVLLYPIVTTFTRMSLFGGHRNTEDDDDEVFRGNSLMRSSSNGGLQGGRGDAKGGLGGSSGGQPGSGAGTGGVGGSGGPHGGHGGARPSHRPGALLERLRDGRLGGVEKLNAALAQRRANLSVPRNRGQQQHQHAAVNSFDSLESRQSPSSPALQLSSPAHSKSM